MVPLKLASVVKTPVPDSLNILPRFDVPPLWVVPKKLPAASAIRSERGASPLAPVKVANVVSVAAWLADAPSAANNQPKADAKRRTRPVPDSISMLAKRIAVMTFSLAACLRVLFEHDRRTHVMTHKAVPAIELAVKRICPKPPKNYGERYGIRAQVYFR